jgi:hypothetical protein
LMSVSLAVFEPALAPWANIGTLDNSNAPTTVRMATALFFGISLSLELFTARICALA